MKPTNSKEPQEISLKAWVMEEAKRQGVKPTAVHMRISRGKYPNLRLRKVNKRQIYVLCGD